MNKNGQSTLEFLFSFIFAFTFIFLFVQIAFHFSNGFLLHYATFMGSRAYMVIDTNSNEPQGSDQKSEKIAQEVFESILKEYAPRLIKPLSFNSPQFSGNKLYVGPYIKIEKNLSPSNFVAKDIKLTLLSESFLGKEPTRSECLQRVCYAMQELNSNCEQHVTLVDNGC